MRYLGHLAKAEELSKLVKRDGLEHVDNWPHENGVDQVLRFVRYEAGARSGKFHHYVSADMPLAEFERVKEKL